MSCSLVWFSLKTQKIIKNTKSSEILKVLGFWQAISGWLIHIQSNGGFQYLKLKMAITINNFIVRAFVDRCVVGAERIVFIWRLLFAHWDPLGQQRWSHYQVVHSIFKWMWLIVIFRSMSNIQDLRDGYSFTRVLWCGVNFIWKFPFKILFLF